VLSKLLLSALLFSAVTPFVPAQPVPAAATAATISGSVADSTGAIIPGAHIQLRSAAGAVLAESATDGNGDFRLAAPGSGNYNLTIAIAGFETALRPVHVGNTSVGPLAITLAVATNVTQVNVNASSDVDLTNSATNGDTAVLSSSDLKSLPVFDNDYVTAMSSFLDSGDAGTAGSGLMVDGVEANRATVSPSAVQEVHINQDPYSAQYYRPGRGQMEIITKQAADSYHGQFNFLFRDASLNAQNAFAPSKPPEQRRIYEGNVTGPLLHSKKTAFLFSFNRAEEDLDAIVNATNVPLADGTVAETYNVNVPAPTRDTEFSLRVGRQFNDKNSAYAMYSFEDSTNRNGGVGNQTLAASGYNTEYREDDLVFHDDLVLSPTQLNQASIVLERVANPTSSAVIDPSMPHINVKGDFSSGSAEADQNRTEYNLRANEMVSWTRGPHNIRFGVNMPHFSRRVLDDNTNTLGSYTFSPTYAADGSLQTTAIQNYLDHNPSAFSQAQGQVRFVYHQQEFGAFIQDQYKVTPRFSLTPGVRYDWQNFLSGHVLNFSPRLSFAFVLDQPSELVLRGGGGIYYDRFGGGPLADLVRYQADLAAGQQPARRLVQASSQQTPLCYPISACIDPSLLPPSLVELSPDLHVPYTINYGLSLDRKIGEKGTISIGGRMQRGNHLLRSIDVNAPTPQTGYTKRPDAAASQVRQIQSGAIQNGSSLDVNYRGRFNKYFTGFVWYSWSHYDNDTGGISWFPQNQFNPDADYGRADWNQLQHFGMYASIYPEHLLNLGIGLFANSGRPYSVLTGTDAFGTTLFNARPDDAARNTETGPDYADLDLRWGYDFKLHPRELDKSPTIGVTAAAFDVVNHPNGSYVDNIEGSTDFGEVTSAYPPRRLQLGMRFNF
jgi:hypothetical protein